MSKIIKFFRPEIKGIDEKNFTLEAVVSTKKVDRDGDIVLPEAFAEKLKFYKDHPVLLSSHDYSDLRKQIGEAEKIVITDTGLEAKFKYYVNMGNPEADWAWILAKQGIASFSIGFIGHESEYIEDKEKNIIIGRKFTSVELLEISQVVVPSNRQALQMSASLAQEELELCQMVSKGFTDGKIVEVKTEAPKDEKQHYSEAVLSKVAPAPKPEMKASDLSVLIKETAKKQLKGGR